MEPKKDNPYQAPQTTDKLAPGTVAARPNTVDWLCAILLGAMAITIVFPTSCAGGVILLVGIGGLHGPAILGQLMLLGSIVLSIGGGVWAVRLYIGAVKKGEASRMASRSRPDKLSNEAIQSIKNDDLKN